MYNICKDFYINNIIKGIYPYDDLSWMNQINEDNQAKNGFVAGYVDYQNHYAPRYFYKYLGAPTDWLVSQDVVEQNILTGIPKDIVIDEYIEQYIYGYWFAENNKI